MMTISQSLSAPASPRLFSQPATVLRRLLSLVLSHCLPQRQANERLLVLEDCLAIGPKKTLTLVQCAGRRYLVATSGETIASVLEIPTEIPAPATRAPRARKGKSL